MIAVGDSAPRAHVGELRLRRFRLGELGENDHQEVSRHTSECGSCRARLKGLDEEQRQFQRDISFERFAGGVERAGRVPRVMPRRVWTAGVLAFAAAAALLIVLRPHDGTVHGRNGIKGGSDATIRIASADGRAQRAAAAGSMQALRAGERVRLGYRATRPAHLVAVSIDDAGTVTPLYPERGPGLMVEGRADLSYLPDSLEFTGHGRERVFLLLSERPLAVDEVARATRAAHEGAHGDLGALSAVPIEGRGQVEQFTWLLQKP